MLPRELDRSAPFLSSVYFLPPKFLAAEFLSDVFRFLFSDGIWAACFPLDIPRPRVAEASTLLLSDFKEPVGFLPTVVVELFVPVRTFSSELTLSGFLPTWAELKPFLLWP